MLHRMLAAAFQQVHEAGQVAVHVSLGIRQGIADPGLRRHVQHDLRLPFPEYPIQRRPVGQVGLHKLEARSPLQLRQPRPLQRRVVVIVEIVVAQHLLATVEELPSTIEANEAGGTRDEDFHVLDAEEAGEWRILIQPAPRARAGP